MKQPLPVGHELQDLNEELPQAFPPHLALQLHFVANKESRGVHRTVPRRGSCSRGACCPDPEWLSVGSTTWSPPSTQVKPQFLPVQDFIPALHIKPEVRKGNWDGTVFPSNEVPGSVISHFLPFLSVLPAPFTLLIPKELGQSGQGTLEESHWGAGLPSVRPCLHCLHIGFGEVKGPIHSSWLQSRHSLTFNGDIQPEKRTGRHQG